MTMACRGDGTGCGPPSQCPPAPPSLRLCRPPPVPPPLPATPPEMLGGPYHSHGHPHQAREQHQQLAPPGMGVMGPSPGISVRHDDGTAPPGQQHSQHSYQGFPFQPSLNRGQSLQQQQFPPHQMNHAPPGQFPSSGPVEGSLLFTEEHSRRSNDAQLGLEDNGGLPSSLLRLPQQGVPDSLGAGLGSELGAILSLGEADDGGAGAGSLGCSISLPPGLSSDSQVSLILCTHLKTIYFTIVFLT